MAKFFGWLFFFIMGFSVCGFFFDWVDLSKNKDEQRIEFYLNTGKVSSDVGCWYKVASDFVTSF